MKNVVSAMILDSSINAKSHLHFRFFRQKLAICILVFFASVIFHSQTAQAQTTPTYTITIPQTAQWKTILPNFLGGSATTSSPAQTCYRQMLGYGGSGFLAPKKISWNDYYCRWEHGRILPGHIYAVCPGSILVQPGFCSPGVNSQRAEVSCDDGSNNQSSAPNINIGNPISLEAGTKVQQEQDYSSADGLLRVERSYRSRPRGPARYTSEEPNGFGRNWLGILPGRLSIADAQAGTIEYLPSKGGGGLHVFKSANPVDAQNIAYNNVSQSRVRVTIIAPLTTSRTDYLYTQPSIPNGPGEIRIDFPDGAYTLYRRVGAYSSAEIRRYAIPIEQVTASGYHQYFDYNGDEAKPYRVRDSFNRQMQLTWDASNGNDGKIGGSEFVITAIALPDGTSLKYDYDNGSTWVDPSTPVVVKDRLKSVKRLNSTQTILWGRDYLYEDVNYPYALTGMQDQNGQRLSTYSYNAQGLAVSTEQAGGVNHYSVTHSGVGSSSVKHVVTNPLGRVSNYLYDVPTGGPANVATVLTKIDSIATSTVPADSESFTYASNLVTGHSDASGVNVSMTNIVAEGRPSSVTEAVGTVGARTTNITWHPIFDLPLREERSGLRIDYSYDGQGRIVSRTETDMTTGSAPYSTNGAVRNTTFQWNGNGRIASINGPLTPDAQGHDDIVQFFYDGNGNLTSIINPLGQMTQYGNYDANGRPGSATDANGLVTTYAYDQLGRAITVTRVDPNNPLLNAVTSIEYDNEGRVIGITAPLTAKLSMAYDLAGRLLSISAPDGEKIEYNYDAMNNMLSQTVRRTNGTAASSITHIFDSLGRMLSETLGAGRTQSYAYDKADNLVSVTSARGFTTQASFDALGRLVGSVMPGSATTTGSYNGFDDITAITDPVTVTTGYVRNGFGNIIQETSPDRGTSIYYYNSAGQRIAVVDGRGQRVDYTRDILGRILSKIPQNKPTEAINYIYDIPSIAGSFGIGHLSNMIDASGTTSFGYDAHGNLSTKIQTVGSGTATLSYSYDLADRIVRITYPSGRGVKYLRDSKGRVASVTSWANSSSPAITLMSSATYESFGALKTATFGNGTILNQDLGDDGRLASKRLLRSSDNSNIASLTYAYDNDDNITNITDGVNAANSVDYTYDNRSRISSVYSPSATLARQDFSYDANGNRTSVQWRALAGDVNPVAVDSYALSIGTNRLASIANASGVRSFVPDARGNLSSETRPNGISINAAYDGYGRLISYARTGEADLSNSYNGLDERVSQSNIIGGTINSVKRYVYDGMGRILGEYGTGAGDVLGEYIYLNPDAANDNPSPFGGDDGMGGYGLLGVASRDSMGAPIVQWIHSNHLGVPILTLDSAGNLPTATASYSQAVFPGQIRTYADLYYNYYRDYDPTTGRYIQSDPIGLAGGSNPYLYAEGNPVRYVDPSGRCIWDGCVVEAIVVEAALTAAFDIAVQHFWDKKCWSCINWQRTATSALLGGAMGGMGAYASPFIGKGFSALAGRFTSRFGKWGGEAAEGAPIWTQTATKSRVQNAFGHWKKHGAEFPELQNSKQYADAVREFVTSPPAGTLTKTRPNGDVLFFNPQTNTFAVRASNGAPRTMFRPKDGPDYWSKQ